MTQATVVFERNPTCDEHHGPGEFGRVGFCIEGRVFWVGSYAFPGDTAAKYEELVEVSQSIVDRLNGGSK